MRELQRFGLVVLVITFLAGGRSWSQRVAAASAQQTAAIEFVQTAVQRALDYDQGNPESLADARKDFTSEGWREFLKWLDGYLDDSGAPTGSSRFTATGRAVVTRPGKSVTRLSIPGTLKQQAKNTNGGIFTTTYRVVIKVQVGNSPFKIRHMNTVTCGRRTKAASCN